MAQGDLVQYKVAVEWAHATGVKFHTATFDSSPTEGNLLVAAHYCAHINVTQPSGWSVAYNMPQSDNGGNGGQYYKIAGASESSSVTVESGSATEHVLIIAEFEGPFESSVFDVESHSAYKETAPPTSSGSTGTLSQANNLIVGVTGGRIHVGRPVSGGATLSSGYTQVDLDQSQYKWVEMDYKSVNSTAAETASWLDTLENFVKGHTVGVAVYKFASVGDNLTATGIETNPEVGAPGIGQTHQLSSTGIETNPEVGAPIFGQEHALQAVGLAINPIVGAPQLGQNVLLEPIGVITNPVVGLPTLGQTHILDSSGIITNPFVQSPDASGSHVLDAVGVLVNSEVGLPTLGQTHALIATGVKIAPTVGIPALTLSHDLVAIGIITNPFTSSPAIGQIDALSAVGLKAAKPRVGIPAIEQVHVLVAIGIFATPYVGTPNTASTISGLGSYLILRIRPDANVSSRRPDVAITEIKKGQESWHI